MKITLDMLDAIDRRHKKVLKICSMSDADITEESCHRYAFWIDWPCSAQKLLSEHQYELWNKLMIAASDRCALADDTRRKEREEYQITCAKVFYIASIS